ncbi:TetR/AcrR family transcriptional regulator [Streptomyces pinistramenti]|uniref:TetR/AcrR family transcriptional regulator n=1 Tax=Streptomyces pinistramenti TaxID=2884812 RepID=UPI001D069638|nr:TetR/AcrR family transcriptional regulator [Streptomyces pinistramenti]MCB5908774.1 TetR/AcrR family transcriptional regulator [Streptomyces pinistramenti]
MPAARESLLDAAYTALASRPWTAVRMVDVAARAGVSRQTLYNEFGSKEGLARALVRRETDSYLAGVERALADGRPARTGDDAATRGAAAAAWTLRIARANPLVRAALTGCWSDRLPAPPPARGAWPGVPAQRPPAGEAPLPGPAEWVGRFCDRAVAALEPDWPAEQLPALGTACEAAARLTLSCVVAPAAGPPVRAPASRGARRPGAVPPGGRGRRDAETEAVARLVRGAFARIPEARPVLGDAVSPGAPLRPDGGRAAD